MQGLISRDCSWLFCENETISGQFVIVMPGITSRLSKFRKSPYLNKLKKMRLSFLHSVALFINMVNGFVFLPYDSRKLHRNEFFVGESAKSLNPSLSPLLASIDTDHFLETNSSPEKEFAEIVSSKVTPLTNLQDESDMKLTGEDTLSVTPFMRNLVLSSFAGHAFLMTSSIFSLDYSTPFSAGMSVSEAFVTVVCSYILADIGSGILHWATVSGSNYHAVKRVAF